MACIKRNAWSSHHRSIYRWNSSADRALPIRGIDAGHPAYGFADLGCGVCVGTRACLWFPARERFRVMCNRPMDTRTAPSRHLRSCHEPTTGRIGKQLLAFLSSPPSRLLSSARDDDDMTRRTPRREEPAFPHARLRCTVRRRWRVSLPPARRRLAMITCEPASALAGDVRYPPPPPPPPPQAASQAARDGI
jgi:hypothetical protein